MYTTLVKNRVCKGSNGFHCTLCDVDITDLDAASKHAACDENHLDQMKNAILLRSFEFDEKQCIELAYNGIVPVTNRELKCTFCSCPIPKLDFHISEHINGKKHKTKRKNILPDYDTNYKTADTTLTEDQPKIEEPDTVPTDLYEVQYKNSETSSNDASTVTTSNDVPTDKSSNNTSTEKSSNSTSTERSSNSTSTEKSSNNCSIENVSPIHCYSCQGNLDSSSALLYHRMFHLSQRSANITDIITFSIKENKKIIYCIICDNVMNNEENLDRHLKEAKHQKRLIVLRCPSNAYIMNMLFLNSALYPNMHISPNNNIHNTLNSELEKYLFYLGCNIYSHTFLPSLENSILPAYFCFICNLKYIDESLLFLHCSYDYGHKYRMESINLILKDKNMKFVTYSDNEVLKCLQCQIQLTELHGAVSHLSEYQHVMEKQVVNGKAMCNNVYVVNNTNGCRDMYMCPICKTNVTYDYMMVQHLESDYHKNRVKEHYANIDCGSYQKIIFFCPLCKMNFFNDRTVLEHFYQNHENKFKNVIQANHNLMLTNAAGMYMQGMPANNPFMNGTGNQNNQKMYQYCNEKYRQANSVPINVDYALNNLVNLNLDKDHEQILMNGLNTHKKPLNQNKENTTTTSMIRTRNLISFSPRYVKLCLETGEENIFKIDPEKMRKLELGISLTFPYKSDRVCIPCGHVVSNDPQCLYEHLRTEEHEQNLQEMEDDDEYFENYQNQFSNLDLAKSYIYEDSDELVKCAACDIKIPNCDENLRSHIESESHAEKCEAWKKTTDEIFSLFNNMFEDLWYYIEKFFCNICCSQFEFEVDYARHLESPKHLKEVEKRILGKQSLEFDCCILCSSFWYGKSDHHAIHCSKDSHKYVLKSRDFTVPEMTDQVITLLASVEETVNNLIKESDDVKLSQIDTEKKILESVEMVIRTKYPLAKAYLFGSRISDLGFEDSDLDIYLDCENLYNKIKSADESQDQLMVAQECFHKYQDIWIIDELILQSRVPIIKLRHRFTNLKCDISFISALSVEKSKILGYYTRACSPCRKLILYLKRWNVYCRLSGYKGISTFAISWLVIFYLQVIGILPSVLDLIKLENNSNIVAGWEAGVSKTIPVKKIDQSLKELLRGFFSYYAEFDYISDVVCPFLGKVMKKSKFSDIYNLPEEMEIYKTQITEEKVEFFRLDSPMCIQEPIDLSQNITKAVTKLHLRMFKQYCAESVACLQT